MLPYVGSMDVLCNIWLTIPGSVLQAGEIPTVRVPCSELSLGQDDTTVIGFVGPPVRHQAAGLFRESESGRVAERGADGLIMG